MASVPQKATGGTSIVPRNASQLFMKSLGGVREDLEENPYLAEASAILPVGGYRSAIGCVWNAVVDDLRNKIIARSLKLFNKSVTLRREVKTYEDFQDIVNDDELIDGAYKIGVIGWEASKVLKHAKETRHIFDGHPRSGNPSFIKVLSMLDDCIIYVLSQPFPPQIIDIDDYLGQMADGSFDRNEFAIETAISELPTIYKNELANRLLTTYMNDTISSIVRSNIDIVAPILWSVLDKTIRQQVIRRVDHSITAGNSAKTELAFDFTKLVDGERYLSNTARTYKIGPLVRALKDGRDDWLKENAAVRALEPYAAYIPDRLLQDYVGSMMHTYVGVMGSSYSFSRKDFYADGAATRIPTMFEAFDDRHASIFIKILRSDDELKSRSNHPAKMKRLRALGTIVLGKTSAKFSEKQILQALADEAKEKKFISLRDRPS